MTKLLNSSVSKDVKEFDGYSMPPELVMMQFVQRYEAGDINDFSRLFVSDVKTSHEKGKQRLMKQFNLLFDSTSLRKIQIKELKVEPRGKTGALLISNIQAEVKHENEPGLRYYNGKIVFRLIQGGPAMQIAEMAHSVH